jgi:hypothetical protein
MTLNCCGRSPADNVSGSIAPASQLVDEAKVDQVLTDACSGAKAGGKEVKLATPTIPQKPQLVKTAELSLRLESIDKMMVQPMQRGVWGRI